MADSKLTQKVRKKLGMPTPKPTYTPKSSKTKIQVQPSGKGCCGKGR